MNIQTNGGQFSPAQKNVLVKVEKMWLDKPKITDELSNAINTLLAEGPNPCVACLSTIQNCWEWKNSKAGKTLCHVFLEVLQSTYKPLDNFLCFETKTSALKAASNQNNSSLLQLVCEIYQIESSSKEVVSAVIEELIRSNAYVQATAIVNILGLENDYYQKFAMPLFLLDRLELIETNLKKVPSLHGQLLEDFDDFYGHQSNIQFLARQMGLKRRIDRALMKCLDKTMTRFLKKCKLPAETCPNLQVDRNRSSMRYLLFKKYSDKNVAEASWREMVIDQVTHHPYLQFELLRDLCNRGDLTTAHYFAAKLKVHENRWPNALMSYVKRIPKGTPSPLEAYEKNENYLDATEYLKLDIARSDIKFIRTKKTFDEVMKDFDGVTLIGVDAEWKPVMGLLEKTRLALLQIASPEKCFLFDVIELANQISANDWSELFRKIFASRNVMVLGFGISEDLRKLRELIDEPLEMNNLVDLRTVRSVLEVRRNDLLRPVESLDSGKKDLKQLAGLSKLTYTLLGYPLDKSEQCSNWENRPLRETQILYAALDALCLIRCWNELVRRCEENNENLEEVYLLESSRQSEPIEKPDRKESRKDNRQPTVKACVSQSSAGGSRQPRR